jgi:dihydrofolate synthase/folylpolyglutamate synthase
VELLGSPELEYPVVHVTGTNGKTSVVRMTAALLEAAGLSVGSYTSPHLARVNERLVRNGEPVDDRDLDDLLVAVAGVEDLLPDAPSYFEILTAAALRWFGDVAVDVAVVRSGGAGDEQNVPNDVAVVTNVSMDHVEYIGLTLADIAAARLASWSRGGAGLGETDPALVLLPGPQPRLGGDPARLRRPVNRPPSAAAFDLYTPYGTR